MTAKVTGISVANDNTQKVLSSFETQRAFGLMSIAEKCVGYAKTSCPVDTGRLRNSITYMIASDKAYVGTNVEYAAYVELGTSRQKAQPYLVPAAKNHASEYRAIMRKALNS